MRASNKAKFIDKYIGPVLLFIIGLFKFRRSLPKEIQTIGILKENAIGDAVILTAVLEDIQNTYPNAQIYIYLTESNQICRSFLESSYKVEVLPLKKPLQAIKELRKKDHDLFIDYGAWPRINALISVLSQSKFVIGFNTPGQNRHYAYDLHAIHSNHCHELDNYRVLTVLAGVPRNKKAPCIKTSADLPNELIPKSYCVIHPWGGGDRGHLREWNSENWHQIIQIIKDKGLEVLISGSPAEKEKNETFKQATNIAGKYQFDVFMSVLKNAKFVLSVNTGIMHLAAALETKTIGLSGPTNIERWGALGTRAVNIYPKENSCGFLNLGFEFEGQREDCMALIDIDEVKKAVENSI
jgi:ADP-heptose:LPS heptosyltransferase